MLWLRFLVYGLVTALQYDSDNDGIGDETEARVAAAFVPRYFFHPKERFFPCSVEYFSQHATLYFQRYPHAPFCEFTLFDDYSFPLPVLTSALAEEQVCVSSVGMSRNHLRGDCDMRSLRCDVQNNTRHRVIECTSALPHVQPFFFMHIGDALQPLFNVSAPLYTHVSRNQYHSEFPSDAFVVQYWMLFAFNGALDDMLMAGAHEGDWEHVTVVVSGDEQHVLGVYMAAHSHEAKWLHQGEWRQRGKTVDVYVALHSHAAYPSGGVKPRIDDNIMYSFLHDHCADGGAQWVPEELVNMGEVSAPSVRWGYYNGYWGSKKLVYSFIPLPLDSASPPKGPMHQTDYWLFN